MTLQPSPGRGVAPSLQKQDEVHNAEHTVLEMYITHIYTGASLAMLARSLGHY